MVQNVVEYTLELNKINQRVADDPEYKALKKKNKTKTGPGSR